MATTKRCKARRIQTHAPVARIIIVESRIPRSKTRAVIGPSQPSQPARVTISMHVLRLLRTFWAKDAKARNFGLHDKVPFASASCWSFSLVSPSPGSECPGGTESIQVSMGARPPARCSVGESWARVEDLSRWRNRGLRGLWRDSNFGLIQLCRVPMTGVCFCFVFSLSFIFLLISLTSHRSGNRCDGNCRDNSLQRGDAVDSIYSKIFKSPKHQIM